MDTPSKDQNQQVYPSLNIQADDPFGETHQRIKTDHIDFKPVGTPHPDRPSSTQIKMGEQTDDDKLLVSYKEKPSKKHGFMCPYHPLQVFTILFFGYNILTYYIVITPALLGLTIDVEHQVLAGILGSIYGMLVIFVVYYTFWTTIVDPTDVTVYLEREAQVRGYDVTNFDVNMYEYYCNVCKTHVLEGSKHCQQCNRCVSHFDHHCPWLNNCIGSQNYRYFFKMLSLVTASVLFQGVVGIVAFHISEDFCKYQESLQSDRWLMLVINMCLQVPLLVSNGKLLSFHIYLKFVGLTTYQYIIKEREEATQRKQKSKVIMSKRDLDQQMNVENYNSPRAEDDDTKQKFNLGSGKDQSEINQLVNSPPNTQTLSQGSQQRESEANLNNSSTTAGDKRCSCIRYIREKLNIQSASVQPRSIKVQPIIHQGSSNCLPDIRSQYQLDDLPQMSMGNNENMETPTPIDKSRQHTNMNSQLPPLSKKDQLDAIVAATKIRQRTINVDEDPRVKGGKRSSIVQMDEMPSDQYRLNDVSIRASDKQLHTINNEPNFSTPMVNGKNIDRGQSLSQLGRHSENHQTTNLKSLLNHHIGTSSRPMLGVNADANATAALNYQVDIKYQQSVDFSVRDIEEASYRKPSRNLDRGTSELARNSIQSKQLPQNHKNLV